jgi:hypothetical protein
MKRSTSSFIVALTFAILSIGFVPKVQAVSPPPDGAYSGANTAEGGAGTLFSLTTGTNNTALGSQALNNVTTGNQNTATGAQALKNNTASGNTADGFQALVRNTTASDNTATGWRALFQNTTGDFNTANGNGALYSNTTASNNTATGAQALFSNTTGGGNTAVGVGALQYDISSSDNTAIGFDALLRFFNGDSNTATGVGAMALHTTGNSNTANGAGALSGDDPFRFTGGSNNTAVGASAIVGNTGDLENNTAVGAETLPLGAGGGQNNIAIGYRAGVNLAIGDYNIDIGNPGDAVSGDGYTIRIGDVQTRAFIAGIYGTTTESTTTLPVIVDSNGQLGTAVSSERFKKDIASMDKSSEAILSFRPVTFHYKTDTKGTPQFGLIAEEVAKVNPALVLLDKEGKPYTVRYDAVNAMLLNEFLKEHRKNEEQEKTIAELKSGMTALAATVKEQAAQIQKVSAQLEASKSAPQTVLNSQ